MIINKWKLTGLFTFYFIITGLIGNGCSKGIDSPLTPDNITQGIKSPSTALDNLPIAFSDSLPDGGSTGIGALGVFDVNLDPVELTADISSLRTGSAIGDSYIVDISNFLSITPCADCVKIDSISINTDENIVVRFAIRHPFKAGNLGEPPSAINRLDLHVFDVFGILHFPGESVTFPLSGKVLSPVRLVNADGYTDRFDERIDLFFPTEGDLHPYKVMALDPCNGNYDPSSELGFTNILAPTGHNVLPMGGDFQYSDFEIQFQNSDALSFTLVVTAAYGHSAKKNDRLYPVYCLPEFHRKEAWKVDVEVTENTLFHGMADTYCNLAIEVWDWNHGANVDPELTQKDSIKAESDVVSVAIEIPGVALNPVIASGPVGGDGQTAPLEFSAQVFNTAAGEYGMKQGLVKVIDSRIPGLNAGGVGECVDRDGVTIFPLNEFATYQTFEVEVSTPAPIPVIDTMPDPPEVYPNESITYDGSNSYDNETTIVSYEWDFDYDGETFDVNYTGPTPPSQQSENNHNTDNYEVTIALRVTDNDSPIQYSAIGTRIITVLPNRTPVANFSISPPGPYRRGDTIDFDATTSFDPDGDLITYEWDFDYQSGQFTTSPDLSSTVSHEFNQMGAYRVALRVADEGQPEPRHALYEETVYIIPRFDPSQEIDAGMLTRQTNHSMYSSVICSDPNTDDVYVAYSGRYGSHWRIRAHRSSDGGVTWSGPMVVNNSQYDTGQRGLAMCVVPNSVPGTVFVFWISQRYNSGSVTYDGWNIRMNNGVPKAGNDVKWDDSWNQDITMWCLSGPSSNPYRYSSNYYRYSEPTDLCVVADQVSIGHVYLAYVEGNSTVGRSVRLIKTTNIDAYPNTAWQPMTITEHVDNTSSTYNFDQVDLAIDNSHNIYVSWDDNANGQIEIRKYPYGAAPGNAAQVVASDSDRTHLHSPRIALDGNGYPVVVYCDTHFSGGTAGISDVAMCVGTGSTPTMSTPILINTAASQSVNQYSPEVATHEDSGMIFVLYEDRRDNVSYGEIYWTILSPSFNTILADELVNTSDPGHTLTDFDVHAVMNEGGSNVNLVATWEEYNEDTWVGRAY